LAAVIGRSQSGGNMNETFKINVHFDEKGEEIEKIISHLILDIMEKSN